MALISFFLRRERLSRELYFLKVEIFSRAKNTDTSDFCVLTTLKKWNRIVCYKLGSKPEALNLALNLRCTSCCCRAFSVLQSATAAKPSTCRKFETMYHLRVVMSSFSTNVPQCAKKYCFWRLYCAAGLQKCNFYNESGFLRFLFRSTV